MFLMKFTSASTYPREVSQFKVSFTGGLFCYQDSRLWRFVGSSGIKDSYCSYFYGMLVFPMLVFSTLGLVLGRDDIIDQARTHFHVFFMCNLFRRFKMFYSCHLQNSVCSLE